MPQMTDGDKLAVDILKWAVLPWFAYTLVARIWTAIWVLVK